MNDKVEIIRDSNKYAMTVMMTFWIWAHHLNIAMLGYFFMRVQCVKRKYIIVWYGKKLFTYIEI